MKTRLGISRPLLAARRALVAGLTAAALTAFPTGRAAAQLACTAALDVDVHYCLDESPAFPQTCNPFDMQDGDTVTLTVEVTNDSQHNAGPPPADPPAGRLQVGQKFTVFYACNASTCNAGERLPGWFGFVGVDYIEPGLTFTDDGNGFSGTLSVTAPVVYPEGVATPRKVLRIRTTANMPPATQGSIVFARAEGTQAALLVTDNHCLPGLTGTGEGSTAGQFGSVTPSCGNTGRITLSTQTKLGTVNVALRTDDTGQLAATDPPAQGIVLGVTNANGACFAQSVAPNAPGWTSDGSYRNPDAAVRQCKQPGIKSITLRKRASHGGQVQVRVEACGDTSLCNLADMTTTVTIPADAMHPTVSFSHAGTWRTTPAGWRFP